MRKKYLFLLFIAFLFFGLGGVFLFSQNKEYSVSSESFEGILKAEVVEKLLEEKEAESSLPSLEEGAEEEKEILPDKFRLEVSFASQAPFANWNEDYNDACEEAAIIITHYFLTDNELTPEIADKQILAMLDFQEKNYSERNKDLEAMETAKLAKDFYNYTNVKVKYNISIEDIKKEIYKKNPVILPIAGRLLFGPLEEGKNPYYREPGPLYHMLVAIGWDDEKEEMIVNDPGTSRGENFSFKYEVLENALHEWNGGEVLEGKKVMIVFE